MASVFTYDPDPPRVSSPWLLPEDSARRGSRESSEFGSSTPQQGLLSEYGVTKLEAEPQEGPTEYKLHLLLRPRRAYKSMSTDGLSTGPRNKDTSSAQRRPGAANFTSSQQTRQERLQHLTTQLLWRLQQSSPYHASSSKELVIPRLSDQIMDGSNLAERQPIVPGLEESRGALYEIGVSDDGTLVGLTKDELDESITTLRIMAASLGCSVEVVRMIIVGDCEWIDSSEKMVNLDQTDRPNVQHGRLWVAEALVTPHVGLRKDADAEEEQFLHNIDLARTSDTDETDPVPDHGGSTTEQLRITFTGPTTSGKSSLLGTLSTGTLDNGRGKSRLSLLKHRHEMVSGVTSSIAQELIGYKDRAIANFAHGNIESWTDIHDFAAHGRLVFVSDSGGHPRYRRTVLRGLMNWAPHWSVLCVAADDADDAASRGYGGTSTAEEVLGAAAATVDLMQAHLTLSLKLDVPMAIVITKLDLASKASLQKIVGKVLTSIKAAGRIPKILQPDQTPCSDLEEVPLQDHAKVYPIVESMRESGSLTKYVPIVLTSAVKGTGIGLVHALLESLPLPPPPTSRDLIGMALNPEQPQSLFHVDDTFNLPASYGHLAGAPTRRAEQGVVVSGYLRFGELSVGEKIVVGPFQSEDEESRSSAPDDRSSPNTYGLSISHPSSAELARIAMKNAISASAIAGEWHQATIVSIRNLRLPVRSLAAGQAGSIGLVFEAGSDSADPTWAAPRIRRGMVLAVPSKHMLDTGISLQAASGFTATFEDSGIESLTVGSFVNVYVASVRAAARVLGVTHHRKPSEVPVTVPDEPDVFNLGDEGDADNIHPVNNGKEIGGSEVFLELLHNREWIEMGSRVIILEGGSQDRSGLEGFVGKVIEIVD